MPKELRPSELLYEVTPDDREHIQHQIVPEISLEMALSEKGLREFERLIEHFERTEHRDFDQYFKNQRNKLNATKNSTLKPKLPNIDLYLSSTKIYSQKAQDLVIKYWRDRQKELKRPLLRRHWKILHLSNHGFGEQDNNKIAFAPRQNNKMTLRKGNRLLSGMPLALKLKELLNENKQAHLLVKMVAARERLKLARLQCEFPRISPLETHGEVDFLVSKELTTGKEILEEFNTTYATIHGSDRVRPEKADKEQDLLTYYANIVLELERLDLELADFEPPNMDKIKDLIFELRPYNSELRSKLLNICESGGSGRQLLSKYGF